MKKVTIYTDGACSGNPGPGGWAAVLQYNSAIKEISGGEEHTTNNRMELVGVIQGLSALRESCAVTVCTDSKYIFQALNDGWFAKWKAAGFTKKGGLKNADLWRTLDGLLQKHDVNFCWVKGHSDNDMNNRCDRLAVIQRDRYAHL